MSIFYNKIVRTRVFKASLNLLIAIHRRNWILKSDIQFSGTSNVLEERFM
jgi:hypothetical protein